MQPSKWRCRAASAHLWCCKCPPLEPQVHTSNNNSVCTFLFSQFIPEERNKTELFTKGVHYYLNRNYVIFEDFLKASDDVSCVMPYNIFLSYIVHAATCICLQYCTFLLSTAFTLFLLIFRFSLSSSSEFYSCETTLWKVITAIISHINW